MSTMSSTYTHTSMDNGYDPDRLLVVKCVFDQKKKRITFGSARNCSYNVLRDKIEHCFALSGLEYKIIWEDDDRERCMIESEDDLKEAIAFFASEEPPPSSNASLLSGHSLGSRRITVQVTIHIDYDASLSETSSVASREEYSSLDFGSSVDLSTISRSELEDDEVTVSSKNANSATALRKPSPMILSETLRELPRASAEPDHVSVGPEDYSESYTALTDSQYLSGPFDRLTLGNSYRGADSSGSLLQTELGAAWLRDQSKRSIKSRLGALPEPSDKSAAVSASRIDGGQLSLQRGPSGKYYYSYNSGTSTSFDSGYDESTSIAEESVAAPKYRPNSMELAWLTSLQRRSSTRGRAAIHGGFYGDHPALVLDIPNEVLPYITQAMIQQPDALTTCSNCGNTLDSIRYVCSTCKEKMPCLREEIEARRTKGTGRHPWTGLHPYNAHPHHDHNYWSENGSHKHPTRLQSLTVGSPGPGYELCSSCLESAGIHHALESSLAPGSSPSSSSPENLSLWRRTAPQNKGQLRHAYLEKVWGLDGWQDVQQDELHDPRCSTCNSIITSKRYKCASCNSFNLCRACYSQVHDIHPSHAFLVVLDKPIRSHSDISLPLSYFSKNNDPQSMHHDGVRCAHCLLEIVGARFHCTICESVDICQNCESAGLPGNLDSPDGGHVSSHIMIKFPYPMEPSKVKAASSQAMLRWNGGDADNVLRAGSQLKSRRSSWDGTVRLDSIDFEENHRIQCDACAQPIIGTRYQCANCPSLPRAYNLCSKCEARSYHVHDPRHVFFKLKKPVDRPVASNSSMLPLLYKNHAGPSSSDMDLDNPKAYLKQLEHLSAYCDRCMTRIRGEWFRCVYCVKDLCDACEALDTHDDTHFFVVFKGVVNIEIFAAYLHDSDNQNPPIIPYAVYLT